MVKAGSGELDKGMRTVNRAGNLLIALLSALLLPLLARAAGNQAERPVSPDASSLLAAVVAEVKELGRRPGEDFTRWEFFLGEDDDDTNKDIHAVVLIQDDPLPLLLRVQVTYYERLASNRRVRIAGPTRSFRASETGGRWTLLKCDYPDEDLVPVLRSLLKAIRDKKRLLRRAGPPGTL